MANRLQIEALHPAPKTITLRLFDSSAYLSVWLTALIVLLPVLLQPAQAQPSKTVQAGGQVNLLSSETPITNPTADKGKVSVVESNGPPKTYTLWYEAPAATSDFTDTVSYSDSSGPHRLQVAVTGSPLPPLLTSDAIYGQSFKALFALFILVVILRVRSLYDFQLAAVYRIFRCTRCQNGNSVCFFTLLRIDF